MRLDEGQWFYFGSETGKWRKCDVSRKRAATFIARPNASTEWNGTGLPTVGTVCEIAASTEFLKVGYPEGTKVKIYANFTDDRGVELAAFVDEIGKVGGVAIAKCFRPIRTPEQIAAEKRKAAVDEMRAMFKFSDAQQEMLRAVCYSLYDAGYRKTTN